ncbi:MAG: GNAT family N-acetyltransferase [Bacteroidia bacterium]
MYEQIETERLIIRPIKLNDKSFILDLLNTKSWLQFIGDRKIKDEKDAANYIQQIIDNPNFFYSIFEIKDTGQPIGIITFLYRDNYEYPDIGFAMLPEFEQRGYAFEASKAYLNKVKSEITGNKIIAITLPDNKKSIRLIEKLGLKYEDHFMDNSQTLYLYSMKISD